MEEQNHIKSKPQYRDFNLYTILICSILVAIGGIYVSFSSRISNYYDCAFCDNPKDKGIANGPVLIVAGIIMSVFPIYQLIKKKRNKNNN